MKKKLFILLSFVLIVLVLLLNTNSIYKKFHLNNIYNSLVYVESVNDNEEKSGSGFVYNISNGKNYILTASHILNSSENIKVYNKKKDSTSAKIILNDEYNDIAILEIDDLLNLESVTIGDSSNLKKNDIVYVVGNPLNIENFGTVTKGKIVNLDSITEIFDFNVIELSAHVDYGNSGSPVLDKNGKVIGMVFLKSNEKIESSFMIPINYLLKCIN